MRLIWALNCDRIQAANRNQPVTKPVGLVRGNEVRYEVSERIRVMDEENLLRVDQTHRYLTTPRSRQDDNKKQVVVQQFLTTIAPIN